MSTSTLAFAFTLSVFLLAGCTEEKLRPSVAEEIIGSYYLAGQRGGAAGLRLEYAREDSPISISFDEEGGYRYINTVKTASSVTRDTTLGSWFMTDVARLGVDTFDFVFTNQLPDILSGSRARLVARQQLSTFDDAPDGFTYVFERE